MNTYNDNLRSSVLSALGTLEQELKTVESAANTAMFTLYYAQGATINAGEQLRDTQQESAVRVTTKRKAVENNNLGNNALATANQANTYVQQAVTNTSVGAANVQAASNAILQLAGDMGNILNIAKAADFGTEINKQAAAAERYISDTAYEAECVSQYAMEAAILTSGITASTVQSSASSSAAAISNLLAVTTADYDAISQAVLADNASLSSLSADEQVAYGVYLDANTEQAATAQAYEDTSEQLNLGLTATRVEGKESTDFTVSFNWIQSPFKEIVPSAPSAEGTLTDLYYPLPYPVNNYYLFMVNELQKNTFTLSDAEDIVSRQLFTQYIDLQDSFVNPLPDHFEAQYSIGSIPNPNSKVNDGKPYRLQDTDGNPITTGTRYVVFLMAKYEEAYKKKLNSFEDFLSAPSASLYFTNILAEAENLVWDSTGGSSTSHDSANTGSAALKGTQSVSAAGITFTVTEKQSVIKNGKPEYRCIFLPVTDASVTGENLPFIFNPDIAAQVSAANYTKAETTSGDDDSSSTVEDSTAAAPAAPQPAGKGDKVKARQATGTIKPLPADSTGSTDDTPPAGSTDSSDDDSEITTTYSLTISAATTDNFGNELHSGNYYIPVVLSISDVQESAMNPTYTSSLGWFPAAQIG